MSRPTTEATMFGGLYLPRVAERDKHVVNLFFASYVRIKQEYLLLLS